MLHILSILTYLGCGVVVAVSHSNGLYGIEALGLLGIVASAVIWR